MKDIYILQYERNHSLFFSFALSPSFRRLFGIEFNVPEVTSIYIDDNQVSLIQELLSIRIEIIFIYFIFFALRRCKNIFSNHGPTVCVNCVMHRVCCL